MSTNSSNLEYSIFAMDAYNQGEMDEYPGTDGMETNGLPEGATLLFAPDEFGTPEEQSFYTKAHNAGFYAIAYEYNELR